MWKGAADSKKTKRLSQEEIKKQLLESIVINEVVESKDLNREVEEVQNPEEAAKVIQKYENIKTKKKGIISIADHQGKVFKKFKGKEKFITLGSRLGIHKNTIIFKINILRLCERHNVEVVYRFKVLFKSYHKDIKAICRENEQGFS